MNIIQNLEENMHCLKFNKRTLDRFLITALLATAHFCTTLHAQILSPLAGMRQEQYGREMFLHQIYNFPDSSDGAKSRADFYFTFVNDILTFFKTEKGTYQAGYDINLVIYGPKNEPLLEKSSSGRIVVDTYEETNSRLKPIRQKISISLPPGEYRYVLQLTDSESHKSLQREQQLKLLSFSRDHLAVSDIVFINKIDSSGAHPFFIPNMQRIFSNVKSTFSAYCEIVQPQGSEKVTVNYSVTTSTGQPVYQMAQDLNPAQSIFPLLVNFRDRITIPGDYIFIVEAKTASAIVKREQKFSVHWGNLAVREDNIDVAIEQLKLIAKGKDIEKLLNTPDAKERKILYDQFWQQRDPTPETPVNELKEEFFHRLDFANRTFAEIYTGREGWRTDRGQVYIKNGPPDEIERQPTELNMPTAEIWYYAKLQRRYIFSDRRGTGEFHLIRVE
jgi:GWxTD domain-containing protein